MRISSPSLRRLATHAFSVLALLGTALLAAPAVAGFPSSLAVPIQVNVTPPAAATPAVTGNFQFSVACLPATFSPNTFGFPTPALTLTASALVTPFSPVLSGTANSNVSAYTSAGCTVTQTARPAPPSGFLWSSAPVPTVAIPAINSSGNTTVTTAPAAFNNVLAAAIPITINVVPPGGGTFTCNPNPVPSGERSLCSFAANPGFTFISATGCNGSLDGSYFTDNLTAPCTITANFQGAPVAVTTAVVPAGGGTVSCAAATVNIGTTTSCTATPNVGYTLTGIAGCNGSSATSPMTTGLITAACTVTGSFTLNQYAVTGVASPVAGGTVNCTSPVNHGSTSTCAVTTNTGYTYTGISSTCGAPSTATSYTTAALTAACTVTGSFTLNQYAVTGVASPVAGGTVNCTSPVNHGSTSTCAVTTNTGYTYTGLSSTCGAASTATSYTTAAVTAACTVTAVFTLNQFTVSGAASPPAGGTVNCTSPVNHGSTTTCAVTTNTGYTYTGLSSTCGAASTATSYTTAAVTAACTVTAVFTLNQFTVSGAASPPAGGSVVCNPSAVNFNASSSCAVTANAGYTFTSVSGCGGAAATVTPYNTGAVTANCTVTASFTLNSYSVTTAVTPSGAGTLVCTPNPVNHGATTSCTATPGAGFALSAAPPAARITADGEKVVLAGGSISGCGGVPSSTNPFVTAPITAPCTVTAAFVPVSFTVATAAVTVAGGGVSCAAASVNFNASTTCTATANPGYVLVGISGCGGVPTTTSPFTTGPVTAACTVTARFAAVAAIEPALPVPALAPWLIALSALLTALCGGGVLMARRRAAHRK